MRALENNNCINLNPLGNFYGIYANLTLMILFNLNHFWLKQAKLCLKGTFAKASFMFVTIFLDIYENPRRKTFINPFCPKHPKIINWNKKWHKFSHFLVLPQKGFLLAFIKPFLIHQNGVKVYDIPPPPALSILFGIEPTRVKTVFLSNSQLMPFPFP